MKLIFEQRLSVKIIFIILGFATVLLSASRVKVFFVKDYLLTADGVSETQGGWDYKRGLKGLSQDRGILDVAGQEASLKSEFHTASDTYTAWLRFRAQADSGKVKIIIDDQEFDLDQKDLARPKWGKIGNINLAKGKHVFSFVKPKKTKVATFDSFYLTTDSSLKLKIKPSGNEIIYHKVFRFMFNLLFIAACLGFYFSLILLTLNLKIIKDCVRAGPGIKWLLFTFLFLGLAYIFEISRQLALASWLGVFSYICLVVSIVIKFKDFYRKNLTSEPKKEAEPRYSRVYKKVTKNRFGRLGLAIFVFLILAVIFTWPVILNMKTQGYGPIKGTDNQGALWRLWWTGYSAQQEIKDVNFLPIVAYPLGKSQSITNNYLWFLEGKFLTKLGGDIFALNSIILLSFVLSGLFMYLLVFYLTKSKLSALIAGIIYSFCPYHFNKSWEHLSLAVIEWLPLYVLFLMKWKDSPSFKNSLLCLMGFSIIVYFNYYYAFFMGIFTLGFFIFVLLYRRKAKVKFRKMALYLVLILLIAFVVTLPVTLPMLKNFFGVSAKSIAAKADLTRPIKYLLAQSARPLSYLLPATANPFLGKITEPFLGKFFYGRSTIEHTLYLGWLPLLLAFSAYRNWKRKPGNQRNFAIGFFIFSAWLMFLFSLPPYFSLGPLKIYFPSFFLYKLMPAVRAYARLGILVMLSVSVLAGFGFNYIFQKLATAKKKLIFISFVICVIIFEFTNVPPSRVTDLSNPPEAYQWLAQQKGEFAIVEYPLSEGGLGEAAVGLDYLFYQRIHGKWLINGVQANKDYPQIKGKIVKIDSPQTASYLKWLGARFVFLHMDYLKSRSSTGALEIAGDISALEKLEGMELVKDFGNIRVYSIKAKPVDPLGDVE